MAVKTKNILKLTYFEYSTHGFKLFYLALKKKIYKYKRTIFIPQHVTLRYGLVKFSRLLTMFEQIFVLWIRL